MDNAALPIMPAADVSLIALFLQAHWVVKTVMLGLLACSVWVWAIAIDKTFLYARNRRAELKEIIARHAAAYLEAPHEDQRMGRVRRVLNKVNQA